MSKNMGPGEIIAYQVNSKVLTDKPFHIIFDLFKKKNRLQERISKKLAIKYLQTAAIELITAAFTKRPC
jgi:hypothetical protein